MGLVVIKQYIYQVYIPITNSTFSISILLFPVWFSWMPISALYRWQHWEVMAVPVLWTLSRVKIPFLSKCACFERFFIPELGYLLAKDVFCAQIIWGAGAIFWHFLLVSEKKQSDTQNAQPRLLTGRLGRKPMEQHEDCLRFRRLILWIRNSTWLLTS